MRITHWINLTNGLQAIRDYHLTDWRALRLQSTYCEQKRWEDALASIPDEMLLRLVMGEECRVYDYGARKPQPRACWQGLEWVRYALTRRWTGEVLQPVGRAATSGLYFDQQYRQLSDRSRHRLDYFANLTGRPGRPMITAVCGPTDRDGDRAWMAGWLATLLLLVSPAMAAEALPSTFPPGMQEPMSGMVVCAGGIATAGGCPIDVPAPGAALGLAACWRFSRKLRRRIRQGQVGGLA